MSRQDLAGGDMDWIRGKVYLKPDDQLQLPEIVSNLTSLCDIHQNSININFVLL